MRQAGLPLKTTMHIMAALNQTELHAKAALRHHRAVLAARAAHRAGSLVNLGLPGGDWPIQV